MGALLNQQILYALATSVSNIAFGLEEMTATISVTSSFYVPLPEVTELLFMETVKKITYLGFNAANLTNYGLGMLFSGGTGRRIPWII